MSKFRKLYDKLESDFENGADVQNWQHYCNQNRHLKALIHKNDCISDYYDHVNNRLMFYTGDCMDVYRSDSIFSDEQYGVNKQYYRINSHNN
jgi:hypothetical protein